MLRAIVFDFDGVIANSEPLHFQAYRDVLANHGIALSETDYYSRYLGYDDYGAFAAIGAHANRPWSSKNLMELIREKALRMEALEHGEAVLFPGAARVIQAAAKAVPIAIASGALGAEIRRILDSADLTRCFTAIVAAEDTTASKPAPDPYLRAVSLLSNAIGPLLPGDCVALEDSRWGIESARAAGLRTIGVEQTYRAADLPADLVIPTIASFDIQTARALF